jgi:hypothetical protein
MACSARWPLPFYFGSCACESKFWLGEQETALPSNEVEIDAPRNDVGFTAATRYSDLQVGIMRWRALIVEKSMSKGRSSSMSIPSCHLRDCVHRVTQ